MPLRITSLAIHFLFDKPEAQKPTLPASHSLDLLQRCLESQRLKNEVDCHLWCYCHGKSDLAVRLAHEIDAEIINADSMQLYKGMDIGTAKITVEERKGIPHHLMDLLDVTQDANVAWYQEHARAAITDIHSRGKNVIIVGGTGLYIKAILDELNFPDTDPVVRAELELEFATKGIGPMFERLEKIGSGCSSCN